MKKEIMRLLKKTNRIGKILISATSEKIEKKLLAELDSINARIDLLSRRKRTNKDE